MHPDYPPRPVSDPELAAAEARFGFAFPGDHRDAVLRFGLVAPTIALLGAIVGNELDLPDLAQLLEPDEMIASTEDWREMGLPADRVAFASDCCGNLFCFRTGKSDPVYNFDHDFGTIRPVAASFERWIDAYCEIAPREGS